MADHTLVKTHIRAGLWEGVVTFTGSGTPRPPVIDCVQDGARLEGISLTPDPETDGRWLLRIAIPSHLLHDGVQVFQVIERRTGDTLGQFTLLTDEVFDDGLRAEVELLRAEVDLLKRAVRRLALGE